jgi:hypothetical protein
LLFCSSVALLQVHRCSCAVAPGWVGVAEYCAAFPDAGIIVWKRRAHAACGSISALIGLVGSSYAISTRPLLSFGITTGEKGAVFSNSHPALAPKCSTADMRQLTRACRLGSLAVVSMQQLLRLPWAQLTWSLDTTLHRCCISRCISSCVDDCISSWISPCIHRFISGYVSRFINRCDHVFIFDLLSRFINRYIYKLIFDYLSRFINRCIHLFIFDYLSRFINRCIHLFTSITLVASSTVIFAGSSAVALLASSTIAMEATLQGKPTGVY